MFCIVCMKAVYVCVCVYNMCMCGAISVCAYMLEGFCYIFVIPVFILLCTIRMHVADLHIFLTNGCDIQWVATSGPT